MSSSSPVLSPSVNPTTGIDNDTSVVSLNEEINNASGEAIELFTAKQVLATIPSWTMSYPGKSNKYQTCFNSVFCSKYKEFMKNRVLFNSGKIDDPIDKFLYAPYGLKEFGEDDDVEDNKNEPYKRGKKYNVTINVSHVPEIHQLIVAIDEFIPDYVSKHYSEWMEKKKCQWKPKTSDKNIPLTPDVVKRMYRTIMNPDGTTANFQLYVDGESMIKIKKIVNDTLEVYHFTSDEIKRAMVDDKVNSWMVEQIKKQIFNRNIRHVFKFFVGGCFFKPSSYGANVYIVSTSTIDPSERLQYITTNNNGKVVKSLTKEEYMAQLQQPSQKRSRVTYEEPVHDEIEDDVE